MSKITISVRLQADHEDIRLAVSTAADLSNPIYSDSFASANRLVKLSISGLTPNTQYYYGVVIQGFLQLAGRGQFKTYPQTAASFTCAFASCAKTGSNSTVFKDIKNLNPLFFIHMGDLFYGDITTNDVNLYRTNYDKVFNAANQADLYRNVPTVYMWDDHDYAGNDSNANTVARPAARAAYKERVPHLNLPGALTTDGGIYQSFVCGRVRFIVTDLRSEKFLNSQWKMMSQTQKDWFYGELLQPEPFKVWVNTVPWIGAVTTDESWMGTGYSVEREEIANFIKNNGLEGKVAIIAGDMHGIAIDDGTNSDYATGGGAKIPVFQAAPLDRDASTKGGPWSLGSFTNGLIGNQYGVMNVTDTGGSAITVEWLGKRGTATLVSHTFQVTV
jgi:phosphodiesterase/alkaline phosphatase D-like protein